MANVVPRIQKILRNESIVAFRETTPDGENFANGHYYFSQDDDIVLFCQRNIQAIYQHGRNFF
jgi:hypothetical protein